MSIPVCNGIGKARWTQSENEAEVEIRIPSPLPSGIRPRDLTVEIKDTEILCVRHEEHVILQWRLYAPVKDEVAWRVEDGIMIVELEKKSASVWSCLLDLPMGDDDALFVQLAEINRMFAEQLPSLPAVNVPASAMKSDGDKDEEAEKKDSEEDDLDKLLDEAAEEVHAKIKTEEEETYESFVNAELENYDREAEEIQKKMVEVEEKLLDPSDNEATDAAKEQKAILEEMLRLHNRCRELRSAPSNLTNFLECTQMDLQKARVNVGDMGANEEEEYASEDEKALNPTELMTCGLKYFEDQDVKGCLHFLRLAALHHQHEQSILLLYSIYSQLGSPRGAFILLNRALDDANPSAGANQKVGELYDQGARHFLPLFPAAVYFYQRAARLGSVNAMLSLAQLWLRGGTASSLLSEEQMEAQKSIAKYHAWLQKAIDRGCGSAMFVKGCMHLKGEHGAPRSYELAKEYLTAANSSQPEILKRAPQIPMMLEALRAEEETDNKSGEAAAPAAAAEKSAPAVTSSVARLHALSRSSAGAAASPTGSPASATRRAKKSFGGSAKRKAFWERASVVGLAGYGLYVLAFPLRVMLMPLVFSLLAGVADALPWLANSNMDVDTMF